ncbi:subtilase-type protease inhibitor [Streptomyces sp. KR80]|uniref:subtilase-type protease inhibitor n=1 Tax=Streptomyces sp. KR80 TaxID=3457426 RepID=UPI003FD4F4B3
MRYTLGALGATAALTVGALAGTTGTAQAAPADAERLYAPSALVLTTGRGEDAATAAVERAVLLSCSPKPTGTHPAASQACAQLHEVKGDFEQLADTSGSTRVCTRIWDPVVVTADGVWEGRRVSWSHTFANRCVMEGSQGGVFSF